MNVSVTAVPTVRWKWPGIHVVLCTTTLRLNAAFTKPPAPPKMKEIIASACAANEGSRHGSFGIQPNQPLPPRRRPPSSSDAATVNAVSRLGTPTIIVISEWTSFHAAGTPGSVNWWNPTGDRKSTRLNSSHVKISYGVAPDPHSITTRRSSDLVAPRQLRDPAEPALASPAPPAELQRRGHGERREQAGHADHHRHQRVDQLPRRGDARVGELVEPDG